MKNKIISLFTRNIALKLIALGIGFLIWLFVTNSNDPLGTRLYTNIPISMVNEDSVADIGKVVEPVGSGTVTVKVRERQSVLNRLSRNGDSFYVEADLTNLNSMNSVPLTVTCSNPSVTWDEIEIQPSTLKVNLENKVEQAFPVAVTTAGEVSQSTGRTIGAATVKEGKNTLVAGPESLINIIAQVSASITVSSVSEDTTLSAPLRVTDRNGDEFTDAQMKRLEFKDSNGNLLSDQSVRVSLDLWDIRSDVPLQVNTVGTPKDGYHVSDVETIPVTVTVAGTGEALEMMGDRLVAADKVSVDGASGKVEKEIDLTDTLEEYPGLKLIGSDDPTVSVTVNIEKSGDRSVDIPLGSVKLDNRPKNMKLVFTPADTLTVSVHAEEGVSLAELDTGKITASVDLSKCSKAGTYELPVEINLPEGYELNQKVTVTVNASLLEGETENKAQITKAVGAEGEKVQAELEADTES